MVNAMVKCPDSDSVLTSRLQKLAVSMLWHNDQPTTITPININLLQELFRLAAMCCYCPDANLIATYRLALNVVLPTNEHSITFQGFHSDQKTRSLLLTSICNHICSILSTNSKVHADTKQLFM